MTDLREAAEMALEALELRTQRVRVADEGRDYKLTMSAITALRAALEQPPVKDTRDEEIALLREEIKRLRFCIPEGDAAAAMEYLAYCVERDVAKEQERCIEIVERELERLFDRDAIPICKRIATAIRENK
jgi:predicted transcriptional regulator